MTNFIFTFEFSSIKESLKMIDESIDSTRNESYEDILELI